MTPEKYNSLNLGGGEKTPDQPSQDKGNAGTVNYEPEQTEEEPMVQMPMEEELSLVLSGLGRRREILRNCIIEAAKEYYKSPNINPEKELADLRSFLNTVSGNPEGTEGLEIGTEGLEMATKRLEIVTEGLEIMINIAFEYIQKLGIDNYKGRQLVISVLEIAKDLKDSANIVEKTQFPYETKKEFLERLISLIVGLILKVGPNDSDGSEFRGVKFKEADRVHPNNALLAALDEAARILLNEAAALNNPKELIGTMSDLLKMTEKLRVDELRTIYIYIRDQLGRIINQSVDQYQ